MSVRIIRAILLTLMIIPGVSAASDIASSVSGGVEDRLADGGYFELGVSVYGVNKVDIRQIDHQSVEPSLLISGMYQYKGLFVEMIHQSQDGINLGFNFWNSENWSLDLLLANLQSSRSRPEGVDPSMLDEADRNAYLMSEDSWYVGAGFRATRYWGDRYVFQYRLVSDYYDGQGISSTARLGTSWQVRNWNFHALGSIEYSSATLNRHFFSVSDEEATELFPEYQPGSSFSYGMELGVAYPLSESFVFRAMYRLNVLSNEVTDSPFNQTGYVSFFNASISYVF
ncbi:MipA/OmpV family protein [Shewanella psychropiezotolerans]|uniref:MipA/OmpV family protein n=2 Tax=Shewanella psychropiezotolerans TaxID=2593655 RepID=A0ABX5X861_9GAMM|nr:MULTISPECIES: MipA/OmpV family protein [Shewanella]MPY22642.1 MipA/OmpV family protein [Shewanella sp. YLB-07]QDO86587.1 MipA/OmpV family protein [Shewanella psychropiezotolerans]